MGIKKALLLMGVVIIFLLIGFHFYESNRKFSTVEPHIKDISKEIFAIGNVDAKTKYQITPAVSAAIISLSADVEDKVKKGDLLVVLDSVDLPFKLKAQELLLKKEDTTIKSLKDDIEALISKRDLAQKNLNRNRQIHKRGYLSDENYDKLKSVLEVANAKLKASQTKIASLMVDNNITLQNIHALKKRLSLYKLYAPTNGYIISKDAEVSQTALPQKAILTIVNPQDVWVKAYVDDRLSTDLKVGDKAKITLRSNPHKIYRGVVKRIEPKSDPVTLEKEVDIGFDKTPLPFYIGEQATVHIKTKELKNALTIPSKAIIYRNEDSGILAIKDNKKHFQSVKILYNDGKEAVVKGIDTHTKIVLP